MEGSHLATFWFVLLSRNTASGMFPTNNVRAPLAPLKVAALRRSLKPQGGRSSSCKSILLCWKRDVFGVSERTLAALNLERPRSSQSASASLCCCVRASVCQRVDMSVCRCLGASKCGCAGVSVSQLQRLRASRASRKTEPIMKITQIMRKEIRRLFQKTSPTNKKNVRVHCPFPRSTRCALQSLLVSGTWHMCEQSFHVLLEPGRVCLDRHWLM